MPSFHPQSGGLELNVFDNPNIQSEPALMLTVRVEFTESADPENPNETSRAKATINLPFPFEDFEDLENSELDRSVFEESVLFEGGISYCGYHHPVDLTSIVFQELNEHSVKAVLKGSLDFTYEGLSHLGQPKFCWDVVLDYDGDAIAKTLKTFKKPKKKQ